MSAQRQPLAWWLGAASLVLAAAAVWPWLPRPALPPGAGLGRAAAEAALPALPPFSEFAATIERPLFSPTRRPAPGAAAGAAATAGRFRLQGVMIVGAARHALIVESAGGKALDVAEGDRFDGYTVRRIATDRVVLVSPAGETVLSLGGR